jgi:uncharacterized membrane protein YhhN
MMKRPWLYIILFIGVSLTEVIARWGGWTIVHFVAKPLIIPLLLGYYLTKSDTPSYFLIGALVASWAGDVLLLFQSRNEIFFLLGLSAFLMAHLFYIFCYRQNRAANQPDQLLTTRKIRLSFPVLLVGTGLVVLLNPSLGDLKMPVLMYALILIFMVLNAVFRYGRTSPGSFWLVFAGAVLFMISDSLLAIDKFFIPLAYSGVMIMGTYATAQLLIVMGIIRHGKI